MAQACHYLKPAVWFVSVGIHYNQMNSGTKTLPAFAIPNLETTQDISMHSEQGAESNILPWLHLTVSKDVISIFMISIAFFFEATLCFV